MKSDIVNLLDSIDIGLQKIQKNPILQDMQSMYAHELVNVLFDGRDIGQRLVCNMAGLSGAGKDTIHGYMKNAIMRHAHKGVSYHYHPRATTRKPRPGEKDSIDYYFLDPDGFRERISQQNIIAIQEYAGHLYGIVKPDFLLNGKAFHIIVAISGSLTKSLRAYCEKEAVPFLGMFVIPPNAEVLYQRLSDRDKVHIHTQEWQDYISSRLYGVLGDIQNYLDDPMSYGTYLFINEDMKQTQEYMESLIEHICMQYEYVSYR